MAKWFSPPLARTGKFSFLFISFAGITSYISSDTVHTFVERDNYKEGAFFPGFNKTLEDAKKKKKPLGPNLLFVDHVVGNQSEGEMEKVANFYHDKLVRFFIYCNVLKLTHAYFVYRISTDFGAWMINKFIRNTPPCVPL